jgi:hypothetical protein
MVRIKKILSSKDGNIFIYFILVIMVFIAISGLVMDFSNVYIKSNKVKQAVNRSAKASTIEILEGEDLANGVFYIDEARANNTFRNILAHNLGLNDTTLEPLEKSILEEKPNILEFEAVNATPTTYYSPTLERNFDIENPSIVAVIEFKVRGVFIKKTLRISKLSASQLTSVYD